MTRPISRAALAILVFGLAATGSAYASAPATPDPVAPGDHSRLARIATACPTFHWSAVATATGYELVLYRILDDGISPPLLRQRFDGTVTGWTPSLDRCLVAGDRYAWSVRAGDSGQMSEWSQPALFEVAPAYAADRVAEAVAVVETYLATLGHGWPDTEAKAPAEAAAAAGSAAPSSSSETPLPGAPAATVLSLDGGVVAASFSGDGSTLTGLDWANLANVPAGFSDGTDDWIAYSAGNQLTLVGTRFDLVEGARSGLDADLLDGLEARDFALGVNTYSRDEVDALLTVDNIAAPVPIAPTRLRLRPEHRSPGMHRLSWWMESLAGAASFVVYQADFPITDANKQTARRSLTASLHAAVDLFPGSGIQHFRVEAHNVFGDAGPLSAELTVDTTSRLGYRAGQRAAGLDELWTVPAGGGDSTRVSDDLITFGDVDVFAWSPDAARLAYIADQDEDQVMELYVVSAEGGDALKVSDELVDGGWVEEFAWSPDGSRIAYRADLETDGVFELYVVPAAGGGSTKLNDDLSSTADVWDFLWSPDGSRIAYRADRDVDTDPELFVVPADGGAPTKVNDLLVPGGFVEGFAWSPDGSRIAYRASQDALGIFELYVAPAGGGGSVRLNADLVPGGQVGRIFEWSPDGSRVAYRADQDTDDVIELYSVPASGGGSTRLNGTLAAGQDVRDFAWSPDAAHVAYRTRLGLYAAPAGGGSATRVSDVFVSGGEIAEFAWSPAGDWLAYRADQETDQEFGLWIVPSSGGGATRVDDSSLAGGQLWKMAWSPDGTRLAYLAEPPTTGKIELYVVPRAGGSSIKLNGSLPANGDVQLLAWSPLGAGPSGTSR